MRSAQDGSQDPDRGHGDDDEEERYAKDIADALGLDPSGSLGLVKMNFVALPFHRRTPVVGTDVPQATLEK
jgi:hypothetical protein